MGLFLLGVLVLLPLQVLAGESTTYHYTVHPEELYPIMKMLQADKFAMKIVEYGSAALIGTMSVGWFAVIGKGFASAYRELRAAGAMITGALGREIANRTESVAPKIGEGVKVTAKVVAPGIAKGVSFVKGVKGRVTGTKAKGETPLSNLSSPPTSFLKDGGVGVGRYAGLQDLVSGRVGSSEVSSLKVGNSVFFRKGESWVSEAGQKLNSNQMKEILSSKQVQSLEAVYSDGEKSLLTKKGEDFVEKLSPIQLKSPGIEKRLSRNEVVLDMNRLSADEVARVVNNLPAGTKVSLTGKPYVDENGSLRYHKVAFTKQTDGTLKLNGTYGDMQSKEMKERLELKFHKLEEAPDGEFFENLFTDPKSSNP